jgi:hypothetical protein
VVRSADRRIDRAWGALANRAVQAPAIKVSHIFGQYSTQVALIEDEHLVQAFSARRSHPANGTPEREALLDYFDWLPEFRNEGGPRVVFLSRPAYICIMHIYREVRCREKEAAK